jgi:N-acylneuraminate cytidylyltransferase
MRRIAIIPARGGSKRIPRKNLVDFFGKPLLAWSIEAAAQARTFTRIIVSTDDPEIAAISRSHGADVPFLRDRHADDLSHVSLATIAALEQSQAHFGEDYDTVVQLMPNCPLRSAHDIQDALQAFENREASFQISCFAFGWMNPWWAAELDPQGHPRRLFPEQISARSQDLPHLYCPTGAIWIAHSEPLRQAQTFYGPGHVFHPMEWSSAVDIDDEMDLKMARALFTLRY